jgi:hypothetical protein
MSDLEVLRYVKATAALLDLPLDEARAQRVAAHLARTAELARLLESAALEAADEPAEMYRPAPFPADGAPQ